MHAAENPLELPSIAALELFVKLVSTLPAWAAAVIVIIVGGTWCALRLLRALDDHLMVKTACGTEEGALEALRITQAARRRRFLQRGAPAVGNRPSPSAPADE